MTNTPSVPQQILDALSDARDAKYKQHYYAAISSFLRAEALIISQLPAALQQDATKPEGAAEVNAPLIAHALSSFATKIIPRSTHAGVTSERALIAVDGPTRGKRMLAAAHGPISARRASYASEDHPAARRVSPALPAVAPLATSPPLVLAARFGPGAAPPDIPAQFGQFYFADIPLGVGDCLVQLGQSYDRALNYYSRALNYPYTKPPFTTPDLWLKLGEAYLAYGDAAYRSGDLNLARQSYEMVLKAGQVPPQSVLYQDELAIMANKVRFWLTCMASDPTNHSSTDCPPRHLALLSSIVQRMSQLDAGLDYLGHAPDWLPIFSFSYLRGVARNYAQFAAQANREYISYTQRAEDQTQTVHQLEQAVSLGEDSIKIEISNRA